jgi:hypothetical protein
MPRRGSQGAIDSATVAERIWYRQPWQLTSADGTHELSTQLSALRKLERIDDELILWPVWMDQNTPAPVHLDQL